MVILKTSWFAYNCPTNHLMELKFSQSVRDSFVFDITKLQLSTNNDCVFIEWNRDATPSRVLIGIRWLVGSRDTSRDRLLSLSWLTVEHPWTGPIKVNHIFFAIAADQNQHANHLILIFKKKFNSIASCIWFDLRVVGRKSSRGRR